MLHFVEKVHILLLLISPVLTQLVINVKNEGGDVIVEKIKANLSEDTVILEFERLDGVYISQFVDFTNEVEAMKMIFPPEEDLGQTTEQVLCFLTYASQTDFIASDAIVKLRQKNPGTVRVAEEERGRRRWVGSAWAGRAAARLSPDAARHCRAAHDRVYLRAADFKRWPPRPGLDSESFKSSVTMFPPHALAPSADEPEPVTPALPACAAAAHAHSECMCRLEVCINWYPCELKYCKGKEGGLRYRCGIKTCRRCYSYHFYVKRLDACPQHY